MESLWGAHHLSRGGLSTEGTSGAAERLLLRGRGREAALSLACRLACEPARDGRRESDERRGGARRRPQQLSDDGAHTPEEAWSRRRSLQTGAAAGQRQEVSGKGRSGQTFAASDRGSKTLDGAPPRQPLAGSPPADRSPETAGDQPGPRTRSLLPAARKGVRHIRGGCSRAVLFAEVDGRRSAPLTRSESSGRDGLVSLLAGEAKRAPEAGSRRQSQ